MLRWAYCTPQDITLHRSLGTRLGITLGFDQNRKDTPLYVMDVSGGSVGGSVGVFTGPLHSTMPYCPAAPGRWGSQEGWPPASW